jgi:hypothetical protein
VIFQEIFGISPTKIDIFTNQRWENQAFEMDILQYTTRTTLENIIFNDLPELSGEWQSSDRWFHGFVAILNYPLVNVYITMENHHV